MTGRKTNAFIRGYVNKKEVLTHNSFKNKRELRLVKNKSFTIILSL